MNLTQPTHHLNQPINHPTHHPKTLARRPPRHRVAPLERAAPAGDAEVGRLHVRRALRLRVLVSVGRLFGSLESECFRLVCGCVHTPPVLAPPVLARRTHNVKATHHRRRTTTDRPKTYLHLLLHLLWEDPPLAKRVGERGHVVVLPRDTRACFCLFLRVCMFVCTC